VFSADSMRNLTFCMGVKHGKPIDLSDKIKEFQLFWADSKKNLAPFRSAIGMLEYWKVGILGSGKMEKMGY